MKKYALFAGKCYYAGGGADDFVGWFDNIEDAKAYADKNRFDLDVDYENDTLGRQHLYLWSHVAESESMRVIVFTVLRGDKAPDWIDRVQLS